MSLQNEFLIRGNLIAKKTEAEFNKYFKKVLEKYPEETTQFISKKINFNYKKTWEKLVEMLELGLVEKEVYGGKAHWKIATYQ